MLVVYNLIELPLNQALTSCLFVENCIHIRMVTKHHLQDHGRVLTTVWRAQVVEEHHTLATRRAG